MSTQGFRSLAVASLLAAALTSGVDLAQASPAGGHIVSCRIKGNISSSGAKIYHLPGQRYYNATRIDRRHGERWFCTEQQARQAGWRRSKV